MKPRVVTALLAGCFLLVSVIDSPAPPFPKGGGGRKGPSGPSRGGRPGGGINPASQMKQQLPTAQIQQLTSAFNQNDRNRDGRVSQPEFGNLMQNVPMNRIYTPVRVLGFDRAHPNSFTVGRSGASYWPIRSREKGDGRVPLGYVE